MIHRHIRFKFKKHILRWLHLLIFSFWALIGSTTGIAFRTCSLALALPEWASAAFLPHLPSWFDSVNLLVSCLGVFSYLIVDVWEKKSIFAYKPFLFGRVPKEEKDSRIF